MDAGGVRTFSRAGGGDRRGPAITFSLESDGNAAGIAAGGVGHGWAVVLFLCILSQY